MTDEELAMSYIAGDRKAFDLLLLRNQSKLFSYILFVVRDQDCANDIFRKHSLKSSHACNKASMYRVESSAHGFCVSPTT